MTPDLPSLDELRAEHEAKQADALGEYAPAYYTMPWAEYHTLGRVAESDIRDEVPDGEYFLNFQDGYEYYEARD